MKTPVKLIHRKNDLKKNYGIRLQAALMVSLGIFILLFKLEINPGVSEDLILVEQLEDVYIEDIIQTKQELKAPAPPRPAVPVEVPNDEIVEIEILDIDAELDLDAAFDLPAAPPSSDEGTEELEEEIFVVVEQQPVLVGGINALQREIKYPEMAIMAGIEGRVILQFVVDREGMIKDAIVVRGIGGGCDEEALRALSKMTFKPGKQRGKPVSVRYTIPVSFSLKQAERNS